MNRRELLKSGFKAFAAIGITGLAGKIEAHPTISPKEHKANIEAAAQAIIDMLNANKSPEVRYNYLKVLCDMANTDESGFSAQVLNRAADDMWMVE